MENVTRKLIFLLSAKLAEFSELRALTEERAF